jgi:DME family drug/metabolite transporter
MAGLGIVLIVYQYAYLASVDRIGVAIATLVSLCVPPVLIAAYSALFQGERLSSRALVALIAAVIGTVMLVGWGATESAGRTLVVGVGLALASAAMIAAHFLFSRSLAGRQPPLRPLAIAFGVGAVAFTPIGLRADATLDIPLESWLVLLYLALVPSILAYWLFQSALKDVPASTASVVTLLEPLVASVLAWVLFSERLAPVGWIGAALLMGAIALLSTDPVTTEHPDGGVGAVTPIEQGAGLD